MSFESSYASRYFTPNCKAILRPTKGVLYFATLFVHSLESEYPLRITCLCGDMTTIPIPITDFFATPSKNSCHACSLNMTLTSAASLGYVRIVWSSQVYRVFDKEIYYRLLFYKLLWYIMDIVWLKQQCPFSHSVI